MAYTIGDLVEHSVDRVPDRLVLVEGDRAALIDCGYPGQAALVEESVRRAGSSADRVEALLLTHNHVDHAGSMPALAARGVRVLAGVVLGCVVAAGVEAARLRCCEAERLKPS